MTKEVQFKVIITYLNVTKYLVLERMQLETIKIFILPINHLATDNRLS